MKDQYTLITGASNGIGKAIAECCGRRGMNLILIALPGENLEELSYSIASKCRIKVFFLELDLTTPNASKVALNWCKAQNLQVNILVNNAGIGYQGNFSDFDSSFYENLLTLNVISLTLLIREFLPGLKRQRFSCILNVSSFGGFYPMPFKTVYAASKSYVTTFSEALHEELKNTSVNVSTLCPAGVDSFDDSSDRINKIGWIARYGRLKPSEVAEAAVSGMLKRKRRIIPGAVNVLFHYLSRPLPTSIKAWLVHAVLRKFHHLPKVLSNHRKDKERML
jgi:short-subunit dehydrogenase